MKITTKGRYGVLIMLYLAKEYDSGKYISLKEIADSENISIKYLEKIMLNYKDSDYFISSRGSEGGYKLAKSPDKYKLKDIIEKAEGTIELVSCLHSDFNCNKKERCLSMKLWKELNDLISDYLENRTLKDLLEG